MERQAEMSGRKSGWRASSTGVGSATTMNSAAARSVADPVMRRNFAAANSSAGTSPVGSCWRR